jgi:hypothetical protein
MLGKVIFFIPDVEHGQLPDGFELTGAGSAPGHVSGCVQRRQKHSGQNGDDRNHNQQFYERESPYLFSIQSGVPIFEIQIAHDFSYLSLKFDIL